MFSPIHSRSLRPLLSHTLRPRALATHATALPSTSSVPAPVDSQNAGGHEAKVDDKARDGPLRPHLKIRVNPNHGLYGFFRRNEKDGAVSYDTVEVNNPVTELSGRSWTAAELRRKSFKDLHTLWYVLLRERNLLASQIEEGRRLGVVREAMRADVKSAKCRKSMARIKYVINERRLAYEGAVKILSEQREKEMTTRREHTLAERRAAAAKEKAEMEAQERAIRQEEGAQSASRLVSAGLFDSVPQGEAQTKEQ
ncbi:MRP-L47-domain-containing protein [Amylocystis lapponica]|nr:MRP-L47-domain-containing protein [Amylocystis lapponica]